MANTIQLKRSAVASKVPTTTDLALGEIAINTYDGNLFIKKNNGSDSIVKIANADLSNVAPSSTGILVSTGSGLAYRSIAGDGGAITVTLADGTSGNPTVQFNPSAVSLSSFTGASTLLVPSQTGNSGKFLTTNGTTSSWATVSASPAGSDRQIQYNNAGAFGGATNVTISSSGDLVLASSASPQTATSTTSIFRRSVGNYPNPAFSATQNGSYSVCYLQSHIGSRDIAWWNPPGNATTVPGVLGMGAMTAGGTATARTVATTNLVTRSRRLGYVGAASVGSVAGHYQPQRQWTTNDGANGGGFFYSCLFAISDASLVAEARMFVGMSNENGALSANFPSLNFIGIGRDNGESSLKFVYNGSGTAPTWTSLGVNFPHALNTLYELRIYSFDSSAVYMELVNYTNGQTATITINTATQFPASSVLLAPRAWRTNNTVSTVVAIDIGHLYIEKPY